MLLLFADKREYQPLVDRVSTTTRLDSSSFTVYQWQTGDQLHRILATGSWRSKIDGRLDAVPAEWLQGSILLAGTAGDLSGELEPPTPFLPTELILRDSGETAKLTEKPVNRLRTDLKEHYDKLTAGRLLTVGSPVFKRAERQQNADQFGAQAIDMEAFKVYRSLAARGWAENLSVLKIISDSIETESLADAKRRQPPALKELARLLVALYG